MATTNARSRSRPAARTRARSVASPAPSTTRSTSSRSKSTRATRSKSQSRASKRSVSSARINSTKASFTEHLLGTNTQLIEVDSGFWFRPHNLSVLVAILAFFTYLALYGSQDTSMATNTIRGFLAASVVFVFVGMTQLRNGPFIRPHPVFWRAVQAISIVYLMVLVFLFFQDVNDARQLLRYIDPSLGVPLPEKSYAEDCRFMWSVIRPQLDIFVVAHVLGWYAKALILRDHWLCWILSVLFEVMEYSLEHQLPNFAECWWDHWLLDVFSCNWIGIYFGMKTCEYLSMKTYEWRKLSDIPSVSGKVVRSIGQFTPHDWTSFDWAATRTFRGYVAVVLVCTLFTMAELNAFYLKYLLWLEPPHYLNLVRLFIVGVMGIAAVRESYQYFAAERGRDTALGAQAWIAIAIVVIEALICFKFGRGEFTTPFPRNVKIFWAFFTSFLILFPIWQFWLRFKILKNRS